MKDSIEALLIVLVGMFFGYLFHWGEFFPIYYLLGSILVIVVSIKNKL